MRRATLAAAVLLLPAACAGPGAFKGAGPCPQPPGPDADQVLLLLESGRPDRTRTWACEAQLLYNAWAREARKRAPPPDVRFVEGKSGALDGDGGVSVPVETPVTGKFDAALMTLPVYRRGAELQFLWADLQARCRRALPAAQRGACAAPLASYAGEDFGDWSLNLAALKLRNAFDNLLAYQERLKLIVVAGKDDQLAALLEPVAPALAIGTAAVLEFDRLAPKPRAER